MKKQLKKLNRVGLFGLALLMFFTASSTLVFEWMPRVEAARGLNSWVDSAGTSIDPSTIASSRFRYIDPYTIKDTVTNTNYKTTASADDMFADGTSDLVREEGWYWHWPGEGTGPNRIGDKCTGALAVLMNTGDTGSILIHAVGAELVGPECKVPNSTGEQTDITGKGANPWDENEYDLDLDSETYNFGLATMEWLDEDNIRMYGSGDNDVALRKLTRAERRLIEIEVGGPFAQGGSIWTNDDCINDNGLPSSFLVVANIDPARGQVGWNSGSEFRLEWRGSSQTCIFGRNIQHNQTRAVYPDFGQGQVYISHPGRSNGSEPPAPDAPGPGGPGSGEDGPSCEQENAGIDLSWIICSVVQFVDDAITETARIVDSLLNIDQSRYDDRQLRQAWAYFRNIASFMLIIIGLVMVIGQAVSKE